jgi:nicotinamide-nucleotide amidase
VFEQDDIAAATHLLARFRARRALIATAESCTGGLIAALLTEIPGSSDVVERGLVTYSNAAKCDLLGVPATLIGRYGAVSGEVAVAMAAGALRASTADVAVSVTGIAGPGGGSAAKPVGLVHLAAQRRGGSAIEQVLTLGDIGRSAIRLASLRAALILTVQALESEPGSPVAGAP